jgi:hypothetical protein
MNATNRNKMRFAMMWVNQNWVTGTQNYSDTALQAFVDFLATNYFSRSNYLKIDGKPVLYINNLDGADGFMRDANGNLSVPTTAARITTMRNRAKSATWGYKDLYIVGLGTPVAANSYFEGCSFDAISAYNHASWSVDRDYVTSVSNVQSRWTTYADAVSTKFQPVVHVDVLDSVWTGGSHLHTGMSILNNYGAAGKDKPDVIGPAGSSPSPFGSLLQGAKTFIASRADADRVIMLQAWNEWGEGNVLEPTQQFGWDYLRTVRDKIGFNPVINWSLEDSGTTSWTFHANLGGGSFSKVAADKTKECTGLYVGRIAGATAPYEFAYQGISNSSFTAGRTYRAFANIKTTNVAGNGARLRVDFRNANDDIIAVPESDAVTGTTSDFTRVSVTGTIPIGTHHIYIEVSGSTDVGPGSTSVIDFDDVIFKSSIAATSSEPAATITASPKYVTGSGSTTIT